MVKIRTNELKLFFALSHDIRQAQRAAIPDRMADDVIIHALEELEMIAERTDQPALRRCCDTILREFAVERSPAVTA
jgi:Zn-finger domain-containing protein